MKPNWSLFRSVRDDRFELSRIRVRMYLDESEMINVRLGSDPLDIVGLDVFDRNHIFAPVLEPANDNKFAEWTRARLRRCLGGLRRGDGWRHYRCWIGSILGSAVRILYNHSWLHDSAVPNVAAIDVPAVVKALAGKPGVSNPAGSGANSQGY